MPLLKLQAASGRLLVHSPPRAEDTIPGKGNLACASAASGRDEMPATRKGAFVAAGAAQAALGAQAVSRKPLLRCVGRRAPVQAATGFRTSVGRRTHQRAHTTRGTARATPALLPVSRAL